jgi:hypothetical protein
MAGIDLPLDPDGNRLDAVDIGQEVPPNFITMRVLPAALVIAQESWGLLAAAPRPLPDGRRVSILNWNAAKQGLRK